MDAIDGDPQLASEILALMARELKAAKARVSELELIEKSSQRRCKELETRAVSAEELAAQLKKARDDRFPEVKAEQIGSGFEVKQERVESVKLEAEAEETGKQESTFLEEKLDKYFYKYKSAKAARRSLEQDYAELQQRIERLEQELGDARGQISKIKEPTIPLVMSKTSTRLKHEIVSYMSALPKIVDRPNNNQLHPICSRSVDIRTLLRLAGLNNVAENFLYLPDRVWWCPGPGSHALGVAPLQIFDASGYWHRQKPIFESIYGREIHLFFSATYNTVCYAGTYKALDLRHMGTEGLSDMPAEMVEMGGIVEASLPSATHGKNGGLKTRNMVMRLYQSQVLKGELLGLQCMAFDIAIYNTLKTKFIRTVSRNEVYYPTATHENTKSSGSKKRRRED